MSTCLDDDPHNPGRDYCFMSSAMKMVYVPARQSLNWAYASRSRTVKA